MKFSAISSPAHWIGLGLVLSLAGGVGLSMMASAHAESERGGFVHAMQRGDEGGPGPAMGGMPGMPPMAFAGRMLERVLDDVKATPEQRAQLRQIAESAKADMAAQREAGSQERDQLAALFTQPVVDPTQAEALRQKMQARHEAGSRRMTQALLEASKVLTVAQRQQIAERLAQRGKRHGGLERGHEGRPDMHGAAGVAASDLQS